MKKICILYALLFTAVGTAQAQSCCVKSSDWVAMATSADFKAAHEAPIPLDYTPPENSAMIQFETLDGKKGNAFYIPSDQPTTKVLVVFHEWWGLNDYIKREAAHWQQLLGNVDVYAVDLYDGKVATSPDTASQLASELNPKRAETIIKGALSKIGKDKQIITLGWCMGGAWAFTAAVDAGAEASGCVMYYGPPEKDEARIKPLKTDVLYIWGSQDKFIPKGFVDELGRRVTATGHKFDLHTYDAVHAFANPSNPQYNALAAEQAREVALKFIKEKWQL